MKTRNAVLILHHSKLDIYGNSYHAVEWRENGKRLLANIGADNGSGIPWHAYGGVWDPAGGRWIEVIEQKHPIREFNRLTKGAPYCGNGGADSWAWIESQMGKEVAK